MKVCHACLQDVPKGEAVSLHVHFAGTAIDGHPFDEDYFYHAGCYLREVRLHK